MPSADNAAAFVEDVRRGSTPDMPDVLVEHYRQIIEAADPRHFGEDDTDLITYDDARRIRREERALKTALPRVVVEARIDGKTALRTADELLLTESYVHKLIRENPWTAVYRAERLTPESTWQPVSLAWQGNRQTREPAEKIATNVLERLRGAGAVPDEQRVRVLVWRDAEGPASEARGAAEYVPDSSAE